MSSGHDICPFRIATKDESSWGGMLMLRMVRGLVLSGPAETTGWCNDMKRGDKHKICNSPRDWHHRECERNISDFCLGIRVSGKVGNFRNNASG